MAWRYEWLRKPVVWYVYPMWHVVSFTIVARNQIPYLKDVFRLYEIDELAFPHFDIFCKPIVVLHPYFFIVTRHTQVLFNKLDKFKALIGIDVADSDMLSPYAVRLTRFADAIVVPSNWAREAYLRSGVKCPIYVVPHGVTEKFLEPPRPPTDPALVQLLRKKHENKLKYLLFFLWHSGYRKGDDLVYRVFQEIQRTHKDAVLVVKTPGLHHRLSTLRSFFVTQWLNEDNLVALYDMCDVYLLFSRGGGFEINGLEALARGLPVVAADKGAWTDYLPKFTLVPAARKVRVFPDANPVSSIHIGFGYEIDVQKAVDKLHDILNNLEEYKARTREHWNKIRHEYTWSAVGEKLKQILLQYADQGSG